MVAILRRALDIEYRKFVCIVDIRNPGMMIPLNRGIPKMANVAAQLGLRVQSVFMKRIQEIGLNLVVINLLPSPMEHTNCLWCNSSSGRKIITHQCV